MTIAQQLKVKEFPFIIKDSKGNEIYYENSKNYWCKSEYDSKNNKIYWEDSFGTVIESKPKINELTFFIDNYHLVFGKNKKQIKKQLI